MLHLFFGHDFLPLCTNPPVGQTLPADAFERCVGTLNVIYA
jgi:hypothetical protein